METVTNRADIKTPFRSASSWVTLGALYSQTENAWRNLRRKCSAVLAEGAIVTFSGVMLVVRTHPNINSNAFHTM